MSKLTAGWGCGKGVSSVDHQEGLKVIFWCSPDQQCRKTLFAGSAMEALGSSYVLCAGERGIVPFAPCTYSFLSLLPAFKKLKCNVANSGLREEFEGKTASLLHSSNSSSL